MLPLTPTAATATARNVRNIERSKRLGAQVQLGKLMKNTDIHNFKL